MPTFLQNMNMSKLKNYIIAHKVITGIALVVILFGGYKIIARMRDTSGETKYVLGTVQKGTISSTVSASGQVSASNEIDLKAKSSGDIVSVKVNAGDEISEGALIASIDSTDARIALRNAQISYEKLIKPADDATLIGAQSAVVDAQNAQAKNYADAFTDVSATFQDFPSVLDGLNDLLYGNTGYLNDQNVSALGTTADAYKTAAGTEYDKAKREEIALNDLYKSVNSSSSQASIQNLATQTLTTVKDLLTALKDSESAVNYVRTLQSSSSNQASVREASSVGSTALTNVGIWTSEMTAHASALTSDLTAIQSAPSTLAARQSSLSITQRGADPLDVESAELNLEQKQQAYNDSFITAPFNGTVAKVDVKPGDTVSSGASIATFVTKDRIAVISLNEVDVAKVKTGDKAMLTFDAVDGLEISGVLSDVDQVGTVAQGVVSYSAKVTFDTEDPRILPGMSVSVSIITASKPDVLTVPTSAVKTSNGTSYVLVFDTPLADTGTSAGVISAVPPRQQEVEVGLSDDTSTEIISGLTEGQQIVTRTILPSSSTATAAAPSLLGGGSRAGASGGAARIGR
jgi:HlyD family secretion protein